MLHLVSATRNRAIIFSFRVSDGSFLTDVLRDSDFPDRTAYAPENQMAVTRHNAVPSGTFMPRKISVPGMTLALLTKSAVARPTGRKWRFQMVFCVKMRRRGVEHDSVTPALPFLTPSDMRSETEAPFLAAAADTAFCGLSAE